ncbi:MAG TPA: glycosyl hydrolase 108 family protein [Candidatus Limnocylindrales bacterium]|nr:glycosyl hydrolase 108 family protein [Candidatus Limnocylindrales bacterium]
MTDDEILDAVLAREGGFRAAVRRPDGSIDPDTMYGVTAPVLGEWRKLGRPATIAELQAMPISEAREIFRMRYIIGPGFTPVNVPFAPLREQLIDFGINSGPARAIRWLQRVLGVPETSTLDDRTKRALTAHAGRLVNDALVAARSYMIDRAVDTGAMRKADEEGVESRALSFFLSKPTT